jgi:hypothetical protein
MAKEVIMPRSSALPRRIEIIEWLKKKVKP